MPAMCPHKNLKISEISSRHEDGVTFILISVVTCSDCGEEMKFAGVKPGVSRGAPGVDDEGRLNLPMRETRVSPVRDRLFCPECGHRIYGPDLRPGDAVAVDCYAGEHVVEYRDGRRFRYPEGAEEK